MKQRTSDTKNQCTSFEYSSSDSEEESRKVRFIKKNNSSLNLNDRGFLDRNNEEKPQVFLSRKIRLLLFLFLLLFSIAIDLDSGIIVSCYKQFIESLNMSDFQYGSLNSINTTGKILALVFYMLVINKNHRKLIMVLNAIFHGIYFFTYFISRNYFYIGTVRFLGSFCKVFINIYLPVWIDQYGIKKYKTILMTVSFMINPYGRIIGAWTGTVIFKNDWKKAFIYCGISFFIEAALLFVIPQKYYSTKYMFVEKNKKSNLEVEEKLVLTKDNDKQKFDIDDFNIEDSSAPSSKNNSEKKVKNGYRKYITQKEPDITFEKDTKLLEDFDKYEEKNYKKLSAFQKIKIVLNSGCLVCSSLSRACIFFDFKIIHIFFKKYTFEALGYQDEITFFYYYSLITLLGPSLGSLVGGSICNKFFGGYESRRSIWVILFFGAISIFLITLIRTTDNFNYLAWYIFGFFFTVSGFLPTLSGYIMKSLHKELKGIGSTFDNIITNFFGKLPAPIIYGTINDRYKKENPKFAWNISLAINYFGMVFIVLACVCKWRQKTREMPSNEELVEKTVKDAYKLNRASLVSAKKHKPKNEKKDKKGIELKEINLNLKQPFQRRNSDISQKRKNSIKKMRRKFEEEKSNNNEFVINLENIESNGKK